MTGESLSVTIKYSCGGCGITEREVAVAAREDPDAQDVIEWLESVVKPAVSEDHGLVSAACLSESCELWLPAPDDADWIGQARKQ